MSEIPVTVTFKVEASSDDHAIEVVRRYLNSKGVVKKGEYEITNGRTEWKFGYDDIRVDNNN